MCEAFNYIFSNLNAQAKRNRTMTIFVMTAVIYAIKSEARRAIQENKIKDLREDVDKLIKRVEGV